MIIHNILDNIFSAQSNVAVLRVLNERVIGVSGRETARLANISLRSAQNALYNLEILKIVIRQAGGREHLFTINRENYITKNILSYLFEGEKQFKENLFAIIKKRLGKLTESVVVFGSVARKEEEPESDLDLCIVYNTNLKNVEKIVNQLRDQTFTMYGVAMAPFFITLAKFKKLAKNKKPPVEEIIKDGIVISGKSINRMVNG